MHANAHNFEVDNVKVDAEDVGEVEEVKEDERDMTTQTEKTLEKNKYISFVLFSLYCSVLFHFQKSFCFCFSRQRSSILVLV